MGADQSIERVRERGDSRYGPTPLPRVCCAVSMKARVVNRPPVPPSALEPKQVIALYRRLGSIHAVARELGRGKQVVRNLLRDQGIALDNDGTRDPKVRGLYVAWRSMILRCDDPAHRSYAGYGARGIGYARAWGTFSNFRDWALGTGWRDGTSLLLMDPDRDHGPRNCRWGTRTEMLRLRTRNKSLSREPVRAFGEEKSAWAWARDPRCRVTYIGLIQRLRRGWPPEDAMTLPNRAPAPERLVPRRAIHRMSGRIDWDRVLSVYASNQSIGETAAALGHSFSTLYAGLKERGELVRRTVRRRNARDRSLYGTWCRMRGACRGKYVGRSDSRVPEMTVHWADFWAFSDWARALHFRRGQCLVRINPKLPFEPTNCEFVSRSDIILYAQTPKQPLGHPRYLIRALGTAKGLADWSRDPRCSVTLATIRRRLQSGWSSTDAITAPATKPGSAGHPVREVTAFAQTKGLADWVRDRRCKVTISGLSLRLERGIDPETAITTPPYARRALEASRRRR